MTDQPGKPAWPLRLAIGLVIALAIIFRFALLHRLPGINGDEAAGIVQIRQLFAGGDFHWITPNRHLVSLPWILCQSLFVPLFNSSLPAFHTLRLPVAFWSTVLLLGVWPLLRRAYGTHVATVALLLAACLPVNIAYSRISWEMCLVVPASLYVIGVAATGNLPLTAAALLPAMLVHPTMIFLLPVIVPIIAHQILCQKPWPRPKKLWGLGLVFIGLPALAAALVGLLQSQITALPELHNPTEAPQFLLYVLRLLSGATVYADFAARMPRTALTVHDWTAGIVTSALTVAVTLIVIRRRRWRELALFAGALLSLAAFLIVAGPAHLLPGFERYGLVLVAPVCLMLSIAIAEIFAFGSGGPRFCVAAAAEETTRSRRSATLRETLPAWVTVGGCVVLLAGFAQFYFRPLLTNGGDAGKLYRTAPLEPKLAALNWIIADHAHRPPPIRIVADDAWNYWPLRLLAMNRPEIKVIFRGHLASRAQFDEQLRQGAYAVGFTGEFLSDYRRAEYAAALIHETFIRDAAGRPLIHIWRLEPPSP